MGSRACRGGRRVFPGVSRGWARASSVRRMDSGDSDGCLAHGCRGLELGSGHVEIGPEGIPPKAVLKAMQAIEMAGRVLVPRTDSRFLDLHFQSLTIGREQVEHRIGAFETSRFPHMICKRSAANFPRAVLESQRGGSAGTVYVPFFPRGPEPESAPPRYGDPGS